MSILTFSCLWEFLRGVLWHGLLYKAEPIIEHRTFKVLMELVFLLFVFFSSVDFTFEHARTETEAFLAMLFFSALPLQELSFSMLLSCLGICKTLWRVRRPTLGQPSARWQKKMPALAPLQGRGFLALLCNTREADIGSRLSGILPPTYCPSKL